MNSIIQLIPNTRRKKPDSSSPLYFIKSITFFLIVFSPSYSPTDHNLIKGTNKQAVFGHGIMVYT